MKLKQKHPLTGEFSFANFKPDLTKNRLPENLKLELTLSNISVKGLTDEKIQFRGYVDFHYALPNDRKEIKRFQFNKNDFKEDFLRHSVTYTCLIRTGDLVVKVNLGLFYDFPFDYRRVKLNSVLSEFDPFQMVAIQKPGYIFTAYKLIGFIEWNKPINFLEELRSLSPPNFLLLVSRHIHALEAAIDGAPGRDFNLWALTHSIIQFRAWGQLPIKYLDMASARYVNSYAKTKTDLGIKDV